MPELDILLFELKYIKKGDASEKTIQDALLKATEQVKEYGAAKEFSGKKITAWAIVFAAEKCVERVNVPLMSH
ncbi:MAG: PD-(D/E)XK nuclease domain-containing protein [Methanomicrobiales archaeon]|jgi:hypothetical protein|nr:PD-(D/E)XK nuclease domain-containing protein [Methanomicrobiales archaeon]